MTLASANDLANPDLVEPSREVLIPATDGLVHIVRVGETIRAIAERYGVAVSVILAANPLPDPDQIAVGFHLFVPGARLPVATSSRPPAAQQPASSGADVVEDADGVGTRDSGQTAAAAEPRRSRGARRGDWTRTRPEALFLAVTTGTYLLLLLLITSLFVVVARST
jgi:hypothetical protein